MKLNNKRNIFFYRPFNSQWKLYLTPSLITPWCKPFEYYENTQTNECKYTNIFFEGEELIYLSKQSIFDNMHEVVNGYANGWSIDPEYIRVIIQKNFTKKLKTGTLKYNWSCITNLSLIST